MTEPVRAAARTRLRVIVEADGGARGNPGPAGYGAVVREAGTGEVLVERAEHIGTATNNVAEYRGLIAGLQAAADLGAVEADVRMDSKLVIEQMSGRWQIKHAGLRPLAAQGAALVRRFETVRFTWVPRERNKHADALANAAMDSRRVEDLAPEALPLGSRTRTGEAQQPRTDKPARAGAQRVSPTGAPAPARTVSWAPPAAPATRVVLVRHGETTHNARGRYSGRAEVALSERGLEQAHAVADRLAGLADTVAAVVSSPLSRCVRMAEEIAERLGAEPPRMEPALVECDFGEWDGLTFTEVERRWPDLHHRWTTSTTVSPPGGESMEEVAARARRVLGELVAEFPGRTLVLVSHVTPIKLIVRDALGAGDTMLFRLYLEPAGLSVVDYWPDGGVAVRTINDTAHVTPSGDPGRGGRAAGSSR